MERGKKKINVLRIVSNLGTGGVQRRLSCLLPYFNQERFNFLICSFQDGPLRKVLEKQGFEVVIIKRRSKLDFGCIFRLIKLMKERQIDIVHTHTHKPNTTGRIAAILARVPVIIANEHNVDEWKSKFHLFWDKLLVRYTDKIVVVSEAVQRFYESLGIPSPKFHLIYNGIELEKFSRKVDVIKKKKELDLEESSLVIGTIGRLHPQKGHYFLLEVAGELVKKYPDLVFLVIGKGYLDEELKGKVESLNLRKKVLFLGDREDIPQLLAIMDIFVLTSLREGFPNSLLEAMASSLPVVVTDVGGNRELVVDGESGLVVPPKDVPSLGRALSTLLEDEELRERMGKAGLERARNFSIEKMAAQTEQLYEELLRIS